MALLGSSAVVTASAAVKAGSSCTKVKATTISNGHKYTCIKNGKKLVWSKGVKVTTKTDSNTGVKPEAPIATQTTENFSPWSTNFTQKQLSDAAEKKFREWAAVQPDKSGLHKFISQTGLPKTRAKNFKLVDELGLKLFGQFFNRQTLTVLGTNEKWVVDQLNSNGGDYENCNINVGNSGLTFCLDSGASQGYVITSDMGYTPNNPGVDGSSLLAHEFFHVVQKAMGATSVGLPIKSGEKAKEDGFPIWFVEGSANFVGFSVTSLAFNSSYWDGRAMTFRYAPQTAFANRNTLEDYEIRNGPGNDSPTYPYIAGQLATEYIVASVGFQKMLDIWINFKETRSFEKSFQAAIGMSKAEFYEKFEAVRTKLGMPEVSYKLVCLTNYKISEVPVNPPPCILDSKTAAGSSNPPSSSITPFNNELVPTGLLKARSTWDVTGHASYRLYVTDAKDFQKIYFESGYVNDSRNQLVIDITGLVCKKQFRVVTVFYSQKNGQGEQASHASLELRDLPCE